MILRVLKQQYELLTSTDVVRAGQAAMQIGALALLHRMIKITDGEILDGARFIGGALQPSASGADNTLWLRPGVVVLNTPLEADEWVGLYLWSAQEAPQGIAMQTNNDAGGDDRIDAIALRFIDVEEDVQSTRIKDPITGNVTTENHPQRVRRDIEYKIFPGTPAAVPVAPSIPSGWYRVCDVLRQNGVVNVTQTDITDQRVLGESQFQELRILGELSTKLRIWFGPHGAGAAQLEADDAANPTKLTLSENGGGLLPLRAINTPLAWGRFTFDSVGNHFDAPTADLVHNFALAIAPEDSAGVYHFEFADANVVTDANAMVIATLGANTAQTRICSASVVVDAGAYGGAGGRVVRVAFFSDSTTKSAPANAEFVNIAVFHRG